ncbi:alpha-(1-_3)-arabinofuranosyltransferase family protein [Actinomadura sp. 6N118]|uniref:alpha-(1->3)-arabinofuranosyltransferase domain-containing protein n=1 Tax=Actinomadura sp. 6N118 TaxID=3375151 RepID=UPI0037B9BFD9
MGSGTGAWADRLARRLSDADRDLSQRPEPDEGGVDERLRERFRSAVCCLALIVLVTSTRPGRILADTKIDMAVNPLGFLGRALHLWDPEQFGQLQNQAAGYFFPMGPFYALGDLIGLPAWITQRLWLSLLLCAAFLGAKRLAERLGIGGPVSRLVGAMAYALGPHGLSALGQNSWEYLPLAMLPWIVLPLTSAGTGRGARIRAAARSGVAVALCGGINGTATIAVLAVPAIYLLTRPRGAPGRLRLFAWWNVAVVFATAWWLAPLVLTGRYGFSWLGYTEKADTTTGPTGLIDVLRGAERWINYLDAASLPVGFQLSTGTFLIIVTAVLAALGLAGLTRRDLPERTFLLLVLLAGLAIIAAGHASRIEGPLAAPMRDLLDGPLAPLRNLYKFDGLVRLPLALGLVHLPRTLRRPRARLSLFAVSGATLAAVSFPALTNGLAGPGDFPAVPQYWQQAANWLNGRAGQQAVLAVPGARFGEYTWGRPMDDIVQPLLSTRWGARQLVPQGSPGYARLMDAIDQRVAAGRGSAGLTEVLARMGVRFLLVRNDLARSDLRGAWPARVHEALETSPGIKRVASFGDQPVGGWGDDEAVGSFDQRYPPVEIYEVGDADDVVSMLDASQAVRMYGAPDGLLSLADNGALKGRPVLLDDDDPAAPAQRVVSDALRWRDRNLGEIRSQISPTKTADGVRSDTRGQGADPEEPEWLRYRTTAVYEGIKNVTASSSAADPGALTGFDDPGALPSAALDGDPRTHWTTGGWNGPLQQWLRVDFQGPQDPGQGVDASFVRNDFLGPPPARVAVDTQAGTVEQDVKPTAEVQRLRAPAGQTSWLRIRIVKLAREPVSPAAARVAVSELTIPGVRAARHLRMPAASGWQTAAPGRQAQTPDQAPAQLMARSVPPRSECMRGSSRWVCSPDLGKDDEEGNTFNRVFPSPAEATAKISGNAVLTEPGLIDRLTRFGSKVTVSASSTWTREPAGLPRSAFDGNPATTWLAAGDDRAPTLKIGWGRAGRLSEVTVTRPAGARAALRVTVTGARGEVREGLVDKNGRLRFNPIWTDRITLRFTSAQVPLQISDVTVPGVQPLTASGFKPFTTPCGYGPTVQVNGTASRTRLTGTVDDVLGGRLTRFQTCEPVRIVAGDNRIGAGGTSYRVDSMVVDPGGKLAAAKPQASQPVQVRGWDKGSREVEIDTQGRSYLVVNENFNAGWKAEVDGRELRPVRLDGWRQAWEVPAGTAGVVKLTYKPDGLYRIALFAGLNLLIVLFLVAFWRRQAPVTASAPALARAPGRVAGLAALGLAAGLGFWLAGFPGLALTVVVAVVTQWAQRHTSAPARRLRSSWLVVAPMVAGGGCVAIGTWLARRGTEGTLPDVLRDAAPQVFGLLVVGYLAAMLAASREPDIWLPGGGELRWVPITPVEEDAEGGLDKPLDKDPPDKDPAESGPSPRDTVPDGLPANGRRPPARPQPPDGTFDQVVAQGRHPDGE